MSIQRPTPLELTLLFGCLLFFACALLLLYKADNFFLFLVTLVVTEYGHWFVLFPLSCFIMSFFVRAPYGSVVNIVSVVTTMLAFRSLYLATDVAETLKPDLEQAFGPVPNKVLFPSDSYEKPIQWKHLWLSVSVEKVPVERKPFVSYGNEQLVLDFYRSTSNTPAPCLVVIHGGGWDSGDPDEFTALNHYLARRGYPVAAVSYHFAPRWKWPAQREDVLAALRYLTEHSQELGIDKNQFVLMGRSAGGQIAEAVAYTVKDSALKGCIALYCPADLEFAYRYSKPVDLINSRQLLRNYLGGTPEEAPDKYRDASGYNFVNKNSPPTLLIHGKHDALVWFMHSRRLAQRLREVGARVLFVQLDWATHAFDFYFSGPGGQLSTYAIEYFLAVVTKRELQP